MSADDPTRGGGPLDLAAVARDDAWVEALLRGEHADDDALAVALSRWSDDVRAPQAPAREPVVPGRGTHRRRPRGARLVGLVASIGLIFATGVGQAVARDPAAPLRFVVDRGVSFGERLVGQAPSDDGALPAAPGTARDGSQSSRAAGQRPGLPDAVGDGRGDVPSADGPRLPSSTGLAPSPRTTDPAPTPDRGGATSAPTPPPTLAPRASSLPPSMVPPSMAPRPTPSPTPSPTPPSNAGAPSAGTPSAAASPTPTRSPGRKPHHGVRPQPPSSGGAPAPSEDPGDPSEPSAPPADEPTTPVSPSPIPTDAPSTEPGTGG